MEGQNLDQEIVREFLVESHENLSRLDRELVELERYPTDASLLASIFRTIHTIKGTCGFLGYSTLERITHQAENILSQLRDAQRELTPQVVSLILETVDATRTVLASIEAAGNEGTETFDLLTERLRIEGQLVARKDKITSSPAAPPVSTAGTAPDTAPDNARREPENAHSAAADANIRVGVGLLDKLMDLVGELVLARNQILQFSTEREDAELSVTSQRLDLITSELQEGVMKTRMQPIGMVWNKLPRVVRDIAHSLGKQVRLEMEGSETELDRNIIEAIKDPLVHLVRNACDHGIEKPEERVRAGKKPEGKLTLRAYHEGGQVNIEIFDDGAGIDPAVIRTKAIDKGMFRATDRLSDRELLNVIFQPGFSTAQKITNVSGRGVGMDVVKSNVEKIGGVVDIASERGKGTTVKMRIPLTLAIIPGLVITSGGERFVIPQASLLELIRIESDLKERQIEHISDTPVYRRRGVLLPIAYLNQVLQLKSDESAESVSIIVLQSEDRQFGLVVDGINDTQEIVVKPMSKQLKGVSVYAGATIMGDGRVALILDVTGIGRHAGVLAESRDLPHNSVDPKTNPGDEVQRLLLFRAGSFGRLALPLVLVNRLEEFPRSSIERAGGSRVVQYRDRILPLVALHEVLEPGSVAAAAEADPLQVIVFSDGSRNLGLIVDQIVDVAEEVVYARQTTARKGLLGSGVVGKEVVDFLDLSYVIRDAARDWFDSTTAAVNGRKVILAEGSALSRALIRASLDMAGYRVLEASTSEEALRHLETQDVDAVVAALALPRDGCSTLHAAMRKRPEWAAIPMLALAESTEEVRLVADDPRFNACQARYDQTAMIESLARLAQATARIQPVLAGGGN